MVFGCVTGQASCFFCSFLLVFFILFYLVCVVRYFLFTLAVLSFVFDHLRISSLSSYLLSSLLLFSSVHVCVGAR